MVENSKIFFLGRWTTFKRENNQGMAANAKDRGAKKMS
jgi:hypothetical protein